MLACIEHVPMGNRRFQMADVGEKEEILSSILPEDRLDEIPTGFNLAGHVGMYCVLSPKGYMIEAWLTDVSYLSHYKPT